MIKDVIKERRPTISLMEKTKERINKEKFPKLKE